MSCIQTKKCSIEVSRHEGTSKLKNPNIQVRREYSKREFGEHSQLLLSRFYVRVNALNLGRRAAARNTERPAWGSALSFRRELLLKSESVDPKIDPSAAYGPEGLSITAHSPLTQLLSLTYSVCPQKWRCKQVTLPRSPSALSFCTHGRANTESYSSQSISDRQLRSMYLRPKYSWSRPQLRTNKL